MSGKGRTFQRGGRGWIAFFHHGREFREGAGQDRDKARARVKARLKEIASDRFVPLEERVLVRDLLAAYLRHADLRGVKSIGSLRSHEKPVAEALGGIRAINLTTTRIEAYQKERLAAG